MLVSSLSNRAIVEDRLELIVNPGKVRMTQKAQVSQLFLGHWRTSYLFLSEASCGPPARRFNFFDFLVELGLIRCSILTVIADIGVFNFLTEKCKFTSVFSAQA